MLDKRALRREIAAQKRALSPAQIEAASADLTAQLLAHPLFRAARSLYAYLSYNQEVRTLPLIRQAQALGKRVAVPKVYGETDMRFFVAGRPGAHRTRCLRHPGAGRRRPGGRRSGGSGAHAGSGL
ncbi:MAG: 5-formyltetrahydrofolate cyclo-ligase [Oscillospiraceae bacterium]